MLAHPPRPLKIIVLVIPVLAVGGAEKTIANMANWWAKRGTRVFLISFTKGVDDIPLHRDVICIYLNDLPEQSFCTTDCWPNERINIGKLRAAFRHCLISTTVRPLPVISFLPRMNMRTILAAKDLPLRLAVAERSFPAMRPLDDEAEELRLKLYPVADKVVFQTRRAAVWAESFVSASQLLVIPNAISPFMPTDKRPALSDEMAPYILTAGRMGAEKRFDLFITAFSQLAASFPRLHAVILGDGQLRGELVCQVQKLGLTNRVHMPGIVDDPRQYMSEAECFVLTSQYEGFPNVLLESLSAGCPVVSFDCPAGPKEIIRNGQDGYVVGYNDVHSLREHIVKIVQNKSLRQAMRSAAQEVTTRFGYDHIMQKWENIFV